MEVCKEDLKINKNNESLQTIGNKGSLQNHQFATVILRVIKIVRNVLTCWIFPQKFKLRVMYLVKIETAKNIKYNPSIFNFSCSNLTFQSYPLI